MSEQYSYADHEVSREDRLESALTKLQNELWRARWASRAEDREWINCPWPKQPKSTD